LQVLIDMIKEGTPAYLWGYRINRYVGRLVTEHALQDVIEVEDEMIQHCEDVITRTDDPGIKMMLRYVVEDEKLYHKMLGDVCQTTLQTRSSLRQNGRRPAL